MKVMLEKVLSNIHHAIEIFDKLYTCLNNPVNIFGYFHTFQKKRLAKVKK